MSIPYFNLHSNMVLLIHRQHRHSEAGQARGRAQGQEDSMETQQARHTHHTQQTKLHSTQGKRGSRGTRQARDRQQGAQDRGPSS